MVYKILSVGFGLKVELLLRTLWVFGSIWRPRATTFLGGQAFDHFTGFEIVKHVRSIDWKMKLAGGHSFWFIKPSAAPDERRRFVSRSFGFTPAGRFHDLPNFFGFAVGGDHLF